MADVDAHSRSLFRATGWRRLLAEPQLRYPLLVLLYLSLIGGAAALAMPTLREPLASLGRMTATCVHGLMQVFTDLTTQHAHLVTYDGFSVAVVVECVGVLEMLIYSACVLAFPAPLRARALGVLFGCAAIFVFNLLRIVALLVVGRHWSEAFDFFHLYFWQATLIAMIVGVLLGWIRLFVRR